MADSNITKHALATALRELMTELPFEKINVAHICERCGMNCKSFYYHFKDKYDLVNWIFDTEIIFLVRDEDLETSYEKHWEFIEKICFYFYENHAFYRKALQIQGLIVIRYYLALRGAENGVTAMVTPFFCVQG